MFVCGSSRCQSLKFKSGWCELSMVLKLCAKDRRIEFFHHETIAYSGEINALCIGQTRRQDYSHYDTNFKLKADHSEHYLLLY